MGGRGKNSFPGTFSPLKLTDTNVHAWVSITKAYRTAGKPVMPNSYVRVLNLFYLCDPDLNQARRRMREFPNHPNPIDCAENNTFPFVFYAWGGPNDGLNCYKDRFINTLRTNNYIWFDYRANKIKKTQPFRTDFVKHIQGLPHKNIMSELAVILKK